MSPGSKGRPRERSSNRDRARGRRARRHAADAEGGGLPVNGRVGELLVTRQIRDRGDLAQLPLIQWQIIGPIMQPGELAARAERAEKRWDARVGRAMDVALPNELTPKAQWHVLRGFGLQLRDTYGAALCVSLHHSNANGDQRNVHGHIFMTSRAVDEEGNFCSRPLLPGRSIACRAPANSTICHPITRNRAAAFGSANKSQISLG